MPAKKRPARRPPQLSLPKFVVGIAASPPGERCCRCQCALDSAEAARAFEHTQPLCDLCSLEHAPPFINRCLIAEAQRQRSHHPDYLERLASHEQIQKALRQQLSPSEAESLVWALLQLYPQTVEVLAERVGTEKLAQILEAGERWAEGETEASVLATLDALVRLSPVESLRAHELWQRLEPLPLEPACAELRAVAPRFQTPALYNLLAEASWAQLREAPRRAWELAELALVALEVQSAEHFSPEWLADLETQAWARLGNARRVACELHAAEEALQKALVCYERGSRQWRRKAEILDFLGSLRRDQRRFDEAFACLEQALEIYQLYRDHGRVAKVMINKATVFMQACEPARAVMILKQVIGMIDGEAEPRLLLNVYHNLVAYLCDCGDYAQAGRFLPLAESYVEVAGRQTDHARMTWLQGRIARGSGLWSEAETRLVEARRIFVGLGDACNAAVVSLDLISCLLELNRKGEIAAVAVEVVEVFESRSVHREAQAAFEIFQQAFEADCLTQEVIARLQNHLGRLWKFPLLGCVNGAALESDGASSS